MKVTELILQRQVIGRLVFSFYFLALLFRFFQNATPSGFLQPVLYRYNFDFTFWLFDLTGIFQLVVQSTAGSILFDFILFGSCLLCILYPLKNIWAILFGIFFFIYVMCYNAFNVHHSHPLALMTLAVVPFFFKNLLHWRMLWEGLRYYVCYAYFISFLWKAVLGKSLLFWNMGVNSTKQNLVEYIYHFPDSLLTDFFSFFIAHPYLLNTGLIVVFVLEGFMLIGFFTKRFDFLLIWIPVIVHMSTYFFADVYFFEMLIGVFTFISLKKYAAISDKFRILKLRLA